MVRKERISVKLQAATVLAFALLGAQFSFGVRADSHIQAGAKVYLEPMNGFEVFIAAALEKKHVPVEIVDNRAQADFVISGTSESQKAGWAKMLLTRSAQSHEEASIMVKDARTGEIVFAYAVSKGNSIHGKQSTAEACAKHLKHDIEKD